MNMRHSKALILGASLLLAGVLVLAYGYVTHYTPYVSYDNGYTYVDYVALFSSVFVFAGFLILFFFPFRKWAREHGAIES